MLRRTLGAIALLVVAAACSDEPIAPDYTPELIIAEQGDPNDDFHFIEGTGEGSHGRLGHLSWTRTAPRRAEFTYVLAFRRSFFSPTPVIGQVRCFASVTFGDGASVCPAFTVTFVDAANDWFEARATFTHTYPHDGPFLVQSTGCCRVGRSIAPWYHVNNPDKEYRYQALVNFSSAGSAASGLPALVACPRNGLCQFNVAAAAPGGQTIRWRLANTAEWGSGNVHPAGASVDPNTGLFAWNTVGAAVNLSRRTVYSTAVVMETLQAGVVVSRTAVDFLIELTDVEVNKPPAFAAPTPADGTAFTVTSGSSVSIDVRAVDPDTDDDVTITAVGVPAGATFSSSTGNPADAQLNFTAGSAGNFVVNFVATDDRGLSSSPRSISLVVPANSPPTAVSGGPYSGDEGSSIDFDGSGSSDPDGDALSYAWDFGDGSSGSGAQASHTYADNGTYAATLTVSDGNGGSDVATFDVDVANVAPAVSLGAMSSVLTLDPSTGSGSFADPGADSWTGSVDYGDGTVESLVLNPDKTFALSHAYADDGTYTVTVSVGDDDNDSGTASTTVEILNRAPTADAGGTDTAVECTDADDGCTDVSLDGSGSTDLDGTIVDWTWSEGGVVIATGATASAKLSGVGDHVITLTVTDDDGATGTTTHTVTVEDTSAPTVDFSLDVTALWSPNHKLVKVASGIGASDVCDPTGTVLGLSVTSNEPLNGIGDGNTDSDWWFEPVGDGTYNLWLRAERQGTGSDRVYTVTITGTDPSGNVTTATGEVTVPHNQGKGTR